MDKVQYAYTGPWEIIRRLEGALYEVKHVTSGRVKKKHTMHISPVPDELVSFAPVDGVDTRYGRLHRGIDNNLLYQDNKLTILLAKNGRMSAGKASRHIHHRFS